MVEVSELARLRDDEPTNIKMRATAAVYLEDVLRDHFARLTTEVVSPTPTQWMSALRPQWERWL
jgi:hypothetical protein